MKKRFITTPKKPLALAIGSLLLTASAGAGATDKIWGCGSAWWSQNCWLSSVGGLVYGAQPQNGDTVTIDNQGANNLTVSYYNGLYPNAVLSSLTISGASANATLNLGAGGYSTPLKVDQERIGNNGYIVHSAGVHTVNELRFEKLYWAPDSDRSGVGGYTLSGTGALVAGNETLYGTDFNFQQFGGSNTVTSLVVGEGRYNLAAGTVTSGDTTVGAMHFNGAFAYNRAGHFNQTGGLHNVAGTLTVLGNYDDAGSQQYRKSDYILSGNGQLHTGSTVVGGKQFEDSDGAFYQMGGSHEVDGLLDISGSGYFMWGGTLNAGSIQAGAMVDHSAGSVVVDGLLSVGDVYQLSGDALLHDGSVSVAAGSEFRQTGGSHTIAGGLHIKAGYMTAQGATTMGGRYQFSGGSLSSAELTIGDGEPFGNLTQKEAVFEHNAGQYLVGVASIGSNVAGGNHGLYRLNGGVLNASSATVNANGHLLAEGGDLQGNYLQNGTFTVNQAASLTGNMVLGATSDSRLNANLTLNGQMTVKNNLLREHALYGDGDLLIANGGALVGTGSVGVDIVNSGTIKAKGGNLTLAGNALNNKGLLTNAAGSNLFVNAASFSNNGNIQANAGGSVVIDKIVNNTSGHQVSLQGGTLEVAKLVNKSGASLSGFGNLVGSVQNNGSIDFYGPTNLIGNLYNDATMLVRNNQTLITGHTVNNGTIQTLKGTVIFEGGLTNNGAYISDPSDNYFTDLTVTDIGYLVGETGDRFILTGDFVNHSQQASLWNTNAASLLFTGLGSQQMYLTGSDVGANASGYLNNYAWSDLQIGSGANLALFDGNDDDGGAFYTGLIIGAILNGSEVGNITGNGYNIYYNAALAGNAYLGGLSYDLQNGGRLIGLTSVPLPASAWLMLSSVLSMLFVQRRRQPE